MLLLHACKRRWLSAVKQQASLFCLKTVGCQKHVMLHLPSPLRNLNGRFRWKSFPISLFCTSAFFFQFNFESGQNVFGKLFKYACFTVWQFLLVQHGFGLHAPHITLTQKYNKWLLPGSKFVTFWLLFQGNRASLVFVIDMLNMFCFSIHNNFPVTYIFHVKNVKNTVYLKGRSFLTLLHFFE